jgi:iron(III) transport system ATP-binding protein
VAADMNPANAISVTNLHKIYDAGRVGVVAVKDVSFSVGEGEFYTLLGPSGCGKTTTLRCVAGLERTSGGTIVIDGRVVSSHTPPVFVPPHQRDIGMVFQSYAVWPHLDVFENVAFPLRVSRRKLTRLELERRVNDALELVQLGGYARRMATQLSGGQQQRLALARALIRQPQLLLLDEPLSNLDAKLREHMRSELRDLQRRLGLTTIYVTHDQVEALSMSTRIALMGEGQIVQEGTPRELYQRPATQFVASFLGSSNVLEGTVMSRAGPRWLIDSPAGCLVAHCPEGVQTGSRVVLSIRPESVWLRDQPPAADGNTLRANVETVMFLGESLELKLKVGAALLSVRQHPSLGHQAGDAVWLHIPDDACTFISDDHGVATSRQAGGEPLFRR